MKNTNTVKLNNDWDKILKKELESNDLQATLNKIKIERTFQNIFPSEENVLKALKLTTTKVHEPSSVFASGLKLFAKSQVQPSTTSSQDPSSIVAFS